MVQAMFLNYINTGRFYKTNHMITPLLRGSAVPALFKFERVSKLLTFLKNICIGAGQGCDAITDDNAAATGLYLTNMELYCPLRQSPYASMIAKRNMSAVPRELFIYRNTSDRFCDIVRLPIKELRKLSGPEELRQFYEENHLTLSEPDIHQLLDISVQDINTWWIDKCTKVQPN